MNAAKASGMPEPLRVRSDVTPAIPMQHAQGVEPPAKQKPAPIMIEYLPIPPCNCTAAAMWARMQRSARWQCVKCEKPSREDTAGWDYKAMSRPTVEA